ncbi:4-amino-4-deoxychorismate lyase [Salsuginibacillus halophilus]|uniref:4-amino-4-deoxychorismate lyase n=1 Tax=Salsuginibacillus halophilus TaxID=517424 RepID=A0A2P8H7T4_9BACI|nr:aminodeoxychorismate lyase [Salsuginibacillus halophilus]PSL42278.1 4-amino-4-deoxychorismate lyase [Salsuginibacillus halophilus]
MQLYFNGRILPAEEVKLSPFEHGFMYGLGAFETIRLYNGHPFLLADHHRRLSHALEVMNIAWTVTVEEMKDQIAETAAANETANASIRYNVSAGEGPAGLTTAVYDKPTTLIYTKPLNPQAMPQEKYGQLLSLRRNTPESKERIKSHHYLNSILGRREVGQAQDREGIFLTENGYISEGVVSNIFWMYGTTLYTPTLETGILDGVTRRFVMKLAKEAGFSVKTGFYEWQELEQADEAFMTNSIQEIVPLAAVGAATFTNRRTKEIRRLYQTFRDQLWSRDEMQLTGPFGDWG